MISRISIIGLGLIGGSLAKAFKRTNAGFYITGLDTDTACTAQALKDGSIDNAAEDIRTAVTDSQVVFLCLPVNQIKSAIREIIPYANHDTIITDVGSIKGEIMDTAVSLLPDNIYFIGGHPMAGTEQSGYSASVAHLFENAYYVLTPMPGIPEHATEGLRALISSTGALPMVMDASVHDKMVGAISHLPHVVAAALVNAVRGIDDPDEYLVKLAAGGFKDITRIASSNPGMWKDIAILNKSKLIPLIDDYISSLYVFKNLLNSNDIDAVKSFFSNAKNFRDHIPDNRSIHMLPYYNLYVDIEDKPGVIGKIATLLGENGINIKNIRIINSREDEPGCLVLSLPSPDVQDQAVQVLTKNGYRALIK